MRRDLNTAEKMNSGFPAYAEGDWVRLLYCYMYMAIV